MKATLKILCSLTIVLIPYNNALAVDEEKIIQPEEVEILTEHVEQEKLLARKIMMGRGARGACLSASDAKDTNTRHQQVTKCMKEGIPVVMREETYSKIAQFCRIKANHQRYGFTNDNKCNKKFIEVVLNNWVVY